MSEGRTTIQSWEIPMLQAIVKGETPEDRTEALKAYGYEREKRSRYARVRNARDRERRTLLGAHVPRHTAQFIAWLANREGLSTTAFVNLALKQAVERSDTYREMQ